VRRHFTLLLGWIFVALGTAGLFLPVLPGWVLILLGLSILGSRYLWAARLMAKLRSPFSRTVDRVQKVAGIRLSADVKGLRESRKRERRPVLTLKIENSGEFTILRCAGRILSENIDQIVQAAAISQGSSHVLLDLAHVAAVDARGLGMLVHLHNRACAARRKLTIMNPRPFVRELFRITNLDSVLEISDADQHTPVLERGKSAGGLPALCALIFQSFILFPWLAVLESV